MRWLLAVLVAVLAGPAVAGGQDTEKIGRALEERLGESLLQPGDYLEVRFYEEPKGKDYDFRVNLAPKADRIVSRWSITDGVAIQKSYLIRGVGSARLYADTEYKTRIETLVSNHLGAATFTDTLVFGSVELCPGVAFFANTKFGGDSFTQVVCRPEPGKSYCLKPAESWMRNAKSLRRNAVIKEIRLYTDNDCRGEERTYRSGLENGTIKLTVEDNRRIASFAVGF